MFEAFGSGVGVNHLDNDGQPALFFANRADLANGKPSPGNALYRNLGNGRRPIRIVQPSDIDILRGSNPSAAHARGYARIAPSEEPLTESELGLNSDETVRNLDGLAAPQPTSE